MLKNLSRKRNFNPKRFKFIFGDAVNFQQSYLLLYFQAMFKIYCHLFGKMLSSCRGNEVK